MENFLKNTTIKRKLNYSYWMINIVFTLILWIAFDITSLIYLKFNNQLTHTYVCVTICFILSVSPLIIFGISIWIKKLWFNAIFISYVLIIDFFYILTYLIFGINNDFYIIFNSKNLTIFFVTGMLLHFWILTQGLFYLLLLQQNWFDLQKFKLFLIKIAKIIFLEKLISKFLNFNELSYFKYNNRNQRKLPNSNKKDIDFEMELINKKQKDINNQELISNLMPENYIYSITKKDLYLLNELLVDLPKNTIFYLIKKNDFKGEITKKDYIEILFYFKFSFIETVQIKKCKYFCLIVNNNVYGLYSFYNNQPLIKIIPKYLEKLIKNKEIIKYFEGKDIQKILYNYIFNVNFENDLLLNYFPNKFQINNNELIQKIQNYPFYFLYLDK